MGMRIYQVDAFTDKPFAGNPAAVCILPEVRDERWMQNVAREMNLSETAFLNERKDGYGLRWFTPTVEVELCGHATLASAFVLWERGLLAPQTKAEFHTRSGLLSALRTEGGIELDFPATPAAPADAPPGLAEALGAKPRFVGRTGFDYLVEVDCEKTVRGLSPDIGSLKKLNVRGVIVTSAADTAEFDFVSRFFAPGAGIDEDPVTGSAHCCLGPYWSERFGRNEFTAYQASDRGGVVHVRVEGDRVRLTGKAVMIMVAELFED